MPGYNQSPKSGLPGHGRSQAPRRYAWPDPLKRSRSKDGAYLKHWGSRPEYKRSEVRRAA
jgi:hypothetical protein